MGARPLAYLNEVTIQMDSAAFESTFWDFAREFVGTFGHTAILALSAGGMIIISLMVLGIGPLRIEDGKKGKSVFLACFGIFAIVGLVALAAYCDMQIKKTDVHKVTLAATGVIFDPVLGGDGTYTYKAFPGNGLRWQCADKPVFNDFKGDYLVHGFWADAATTNAYIKARKSDGGEGLRVDFVRSGYGVDIAVPPSDNMPRLIQKNDFLVLTLAGCGEYAVDFRIRIVDERGTHWCYGHESQKTVDEGPQVIAIEYSKSDNDNKKMTIPKDEEETFRFPLSRSSWDIFPNDGGNATPSTWNKRFVALQLVVIEPGLRWEDEPEPVGTGHRRFLTGRNTKGEYVPLSFVIKRIAIEGGSAGG